uniref:Uncharacterized protein n=1 Tax=Anopheles farauti TaxID=69004 RepID=A0A182QAK6_9DIPT
MMDERAATNSSSHQQQRHQQNEPIGPASCRPSVVVLCRTVLTISVLSLLTIGLYVGSQSGNNHLVAGEVAAVVNGDTAAAPYVAVRERRDANDGGQPAVKPAPQPPRSRARKKPKMPKKAKQPVLYHPNMTDSGEVYELGDIVLQYDSKGAATIERLLHVRRYKHRQMRDVGMSICVVTRSLEALDGESTRRIVRGTFRANGPGTGGE